jgi:hypothetical protein
MTADGANMQGELNAHLEQPAARVQSQGAAGRRRRIGKNEASGRQSGSPPGKEAKLIGFRSSWN